MSDAIAVVGSGQAPTPVPNQTYFGLAEVNGMNFRRRAGSTFIIEYQPYSWHHMRAWTEASGSSTAANVLSWAQRISLQGVNFSDLPADGSWKHYWWNTGLEQWTVAAATSIHGSGFYLWIETEIDTSPDTSGLVLPGSTEELPRRGWLRRQRIRRLRRLLSRGR